MDTASKLLLETIRHFSGEKIFQVEFDDGRKVAAFIHELFSEKKYLIVAPGSDMQKSKFDAEEIKKITAIDLLGLMVYHNQNQKK